MPDYNTSDRRGVSKKFTQEIATEVGVQLADYNPDLRSRDAGRVGGRITQRLVEAGKSQMGENLR
ncbi:MAG TPA: small, acid-soluble spore protein, alpha/beta type [Clostridiaceae bacterium]|jgi:small acid-soluble spore protein D (minor alpha/beta-type SASP)|nr:small, acid-soluble spore protein, alpha/beta type [Clostridiaceae bacterium]